MPRRASTTRSTSRGWPAAYRHGLALELPDAAMARPAEAPVGAIWPIPKGIAVGVRSGGHAHSSPPSKPHLPIGWLRLPEHHETHRVVVPGRLEHGRARALARVLRRGYARVPMGVGPVEEPRHVLGARGVPRASPVGHDRGLRLLVADRQPGVPDTAPEQITGWRLTVALEGDSWRVSDQLDDQQWPEGRQYLDLPWAPPSERENQALRSALTRLRR